MEQIFEEKEGKLMKFYVNKLFQQQNFRNIHVYNVNAPFHFTEIDGYIPLLQIGRIVGIRPNNIFHLTKFTPYPRKSIKRNIDFSGTGLVTMFHGKMNTIIGDPTIGLRRTYGGVTITFGFLTSFLTNGYPQYLLSSLQASSSITLELDSNIHILSLGLIRKSAIPKIIIQPYSISIPTEDLRWLISEEKLKIPKFMNDNYSSAVRTHIMNHVNKVSKTNNIKVEVVKDEEIIKYFKFKSNFIGNSLIEFMEIESKVKDKVFSNIKEILTV